MTPSIEAVFQETESDDTSNLSQWSNNLSASRTEARPALTQEDQVLPLANSQKPFVFGFDEALVPRSDMASITIQETTTTTQGFGQEEGGETYHTQLYPEMGGGLYGHRGKGLEIGGDGFEIGGSSPPSGDLS